MIWGDITGRNRTRLVVVHGNLNAARYIEEILAPVAVPFIENNGPGMMLQQDNARPHVARVVRDYLDDNEVHAIPWPANSPDLNPIEHVWDEMDRRLRRLPHQPTSLRELRDSLIQVWQDIPQTFHANLITSMRRRCRAVIDSDGGHTRY